MIKSLFITTLLLLALSFTSGAQTLVNALILNPDNMELNGAAVEKTGDPDRMLVPFNKTKVVLYQNEDLTYWGEFKFQQCGKKVKLVSQTYVELKDGTVIDGNSSTTKYKMEEGKPGWIIGKYEDEFEIDSEKNLAFKADLGYTLRYKN